MTNMDWCGTGRLVEDMRKEKEDLKIVVGDLMTPEEFYELVGLAQKAIRAGTQNVPISHTIAPGSTEMPHPYPPYAQEEIVAYKSNKEVKEP